MATAFVGDRGIITSPRIDEHLRQSEEHPGERLIVCRNPFLADKRARKRKELLAAAQRKLAAIAKSVSRERNPLRGKDKVAEEAALDGSYVIRTNVAAETLSADQVVAGYKSLSHVERAFRSLKTTMLQLRPIYHWRDDRIRAPVFLCMLSYYVEWHLRRDLRPLLFHDEQRVAAEQQRASIVRPAPHSDAAVRKETRTRTSILRLPESPDTEFADKNASVLHAIIDDLQERIVNRPSR